MFKDSLSFEHFRDRLAHAEALPQLVMLGIVSGLITGGVILAFRLMIDLPLEAWLPGNDQENFEGLPVLARVCLPLCGAFVLFLMLYKLSLKTRKVGVVHVLERLSYHQGRLPAKNFFVQFFGAGIAILSGQSVGREGPAIHLGAACGSLMGQAFRLPNNTLRLLVGCGVAAAISASFNTPLAGVVFAMEVILMEYTVIGFTPVLVASVTAALMIKAAYGDEPAFTIPALQIQSLTETPYIILLGLICAVLAAGFIHLMIQTQRRTKWSLAPRLMLAGTLTALVAIVYPQVMGVGYDTVSLALEGNAELSVLLGLLLAKWLLTPVVLGLGIPGGLIGPSFYIGAVTGAVFALVLTLFTGLDHSGVGFYAMLGMGAMMGAVLNAPLAALIALLELTANPNIIFPGMLAIVVASTTVRYAFKQPSVFLTSLKAQGLDYRQEPLAQALNTLRVTDVMSQGNIRCGFRVTIDTLLQMLAQNPKWIVLDDTNGEPGYIIFPADIDYFLRQLGKQGSIDPRTELDLRELPAIRKDVISLHADATLKQALDCLNNHRLDALCIVGPDLSIRGVITREQVENFYTQIPH